MSNNLIGEIKVGHINNYRPNYDSSTNTWLEEGELEENELRNSNIMSTPGKRARPHNNNNNNNNNKNNNGAIKNNNGAIKNNNGAIKNRSGGSFNNLINQKKYRGTQYGGYNSKFYEAKSPSLIMGEHAYGKSSPHSQGMQLGDNTVGPDLAPYEPYDDHHSGMQTGGGVFAKIMNPKTKRMVSIYGKIGKKIINNYIKYLTNSHGGSQMELWQLSPEPKNQKEDDDYEEQWGFSWNNRFNYTSNRNSDRLFLDPTIIRLDESQLEASNKSHGVEKPKKTSKHRLKYIAPSTDDSEMSSNNFTDTIDVPDQLLSDFLDFIRQTYGFEIELIIWSSHNGQEERVIFNSFNLTDDVEEHARIVEQSKNMMLSKLTAYWRNMAVGEVTKENYLFLRVSADEDKGDEELSIRVNM